ncbi:serine--tRNA ligase [Haematospirillum jordaniae]|uniref:Serine--tRNA ligase n=1 Tax=Haematospirillum jordaniae TaxID=1549855 RepID=A0A143DER0_9PROT|nr:serine--tRNA ligase [Haematospirillum jordaniae]AMW35225.1 serine--tRNA ligase [Haematospirillum jordaniae]NKD45621.1 serine--tRNA ligase [Haematospirillum jordaniae]NKD56374.1 serine--tRNA ligase [Haematospirillum jordaniae]NKD58432.1 serine--tRNA ligase [Haematospirillum jordaniae]NKD66399.1 serine--tRNA ligase [Haematospirillum jordaniae]
MLDLKWIRENPDDLDRGLLRRGKGALSSDILEADRQLRSLMTSLQALQARRNEASREIGTIRKAGGDAAVLSDEVADIKKRMTDMEAEQQSLQAALDDLLYSLPNMPDPDVPDGRDENDNVEVRRWGTPRSMDFTPLEHDAVGTSLGLMDFESAAKLSGARFVVLKGALSRLSRALAQFMLDTHTTDHGYTELNTPVMVLDNTLYGTGQLPKFAEDLFRTEQGHWLIPTAEVTLTNMVADQIVDSASLPRRMTAHTLCFRSEAGAAGKDTRGMIRQHQFEKVEMVSITRPEDSANELERMTGCAEKILQRLGLPYRVVLLCAGDMGAAARKTYDLEVWLPGQGRYREISSCSNVGDFQARRMKARYKPSGDKGTEFLHTLNGSGLAVGRTLVAVLENYQQADGSVTVPEALRPYMGGLEVISTHA